VPLVAQSYDLTSLIGRGPTGSVWRARHRTTGDQVAVKLLEADLATDPETVSRFIRERHLLTAALEPTLVPVRELLVGDAELALVTDLVPGPNLRDRIARTGPFPPAMAAWVALDIARALDAVHGAGLVHGELKPTNVLFAPPDGAVRLTDARIARLTRGYLDGAARIAVPAYAAPEVILGGPVVPPTDVYGLGLLLFEMLTGDPLCPEGLSAHLRARPIVPFGLPAELRELIEECLRLDPAHRPVPAAVAAHLRRLEHAPGPAIPFPRYAPDGHERASHGPGPHGPGAHAPAPLAARLTPSERPRPHVAGRRQVTSGSAPSASARTGAGARTRLRIAALVVAVLLVAGLTVVILQSLPSANSGQHGNAGTTPGGPGSVSPVGPPQLTADDRAGTAAGAAAFVGYWFATLTYATASGDTGPFQAASSDACEACASAVQAIHTGWQGGHQLRGGAYTVRNVMADGFFTVEHPALTAVYDRSPRSALAGGGTELGLLPGITFATCRVLLVRDGADWRVLSAQSDRPLA
jgi:serine/threonine-protein kinase